MMTYIDRTLLEPAPAAAKPRPAGSHRIRRLVGGYRLTLPELGVIDGEVVDALDRDRWVLFACVVLFVQQRASQVQVIESARLAPVISGEFRDELALRARVEPLRSVQLDAVEAGSVEEILVHDGARVAAGELLYRLHSPEQEQSLMERSAEVAQQLANVSVQRSAQVASLAQSRREVAQLRAAHLQAESEYQRLQPLAEAGFVSAAALDQSAEALGSPRVCSRCSSCKR